LKKRKFCGVLITAAMIMALGLGGCQGSSSASSGSTAESSTVSTVGSGGNTLSTDSSDLTLKNTTVSGSVTSINGDTIELSVMQGGPGGQGGAPSGGAPSGGSSSSAGGSSSSAGGSSSSAGGTGSSSSAAGATSSSSSSASGTGSSSASAGSSGSASSTANASASGGTSAQGQSASGSSNAAPPANSSGQAPSGNGGTPPSKPDGESSANGETGDASSQGGQPGGQSSTATLVLGDTSVLKDSSGSSASLSDITKGKMLAITTDESGNITKVVVSDASSQGGQGGGGGQSSAVESYNSATDVTKDTESSGKTYSSTGTDENAVLVENGAKAKLKDATITRTSDASTGGDNSSFYGVGAAVLTTDGTSYINGGTITTNAKGGAGAFSYGDGVTYIQNTKINTTQDTSGGIHVAGGGKLYAWNVTAETKGESSAAIRSDRGGGTMVVDGGSYTSNGTGSPAIYSTADITANAAKLTANGSEAACIEGLNTIRLFNCDLSGNMSDDNDQNDCTWNVIVYQSMSGDSKEGNGTFSMTDGTLKANNGGMFYTTNTQSTFYLSDVDITYAADNDFFLKCTGNSNARGWGSSGSNGADCSFTADNQKMEGDIIYDSISQLDFYMENGSTLKGAVVDDESNAGSGGDGYCKLYIDSSSTWTVTADSTLTELDNAGTIVDSNGKTVSIVGTDGKSYVKGDSDLTITVSKYSTKADMSGATAADSYDNYSVDNPM